MPSAPTSGRSPPAAVRAVWLAAGLVCVGLGGLGAIIPGLPTTIFLIGAAACFARSSPRLERWVLGLPGVGQAVADHRAGLGMSRRAKGFAVGAMVVFPTLAILAIPVWPAQAVVGVAAVVGIMVVLFRVPTRETVLDARSAEDDADR